MSTPARSRTHSIRLARLAAFGAALVLILVFKAQASAQDQPAISAVQAPLNITVVNTGAEVQRVQFNDGWVMEVRPESTSRVLINGQSYQQVYDSIPYRRSEYLANPSYRHDTTVELLAGQLRPTVIQRNDTPVRIENPRPSMYQPYIMSASELWTASSAAFRFRYFPWTLLPPVNP